MDSVEQKTAHQSIETARKEKTNQGCRSGGAPCTRCGRTRHYPMHSDIPLDDRIGQTYYVGGSLWRYLYNASIHRFALRRTVTNVPIDLATELIASGEV